jgi:myosin heavy subunit
MSDEQVWVKNTDENSTDLYMLSTNLDSSTEYDYYSKNDNNNIENLVNLTYINLPSIMNVLQTRYDKDNIYTFNGEILISINPFKTVNIYNNKILSDVNSPHIYSIAEKAYHNLVDKNQSILVSGESGSGKTENTKYILRYLCNNYSNNKELAAKIINSNYIIELFGNAKTIRNQNSSRFGKFIKLYLEILKTIY